MLRKGLFIQLKWSVFKKHIRTENWRLVGKSKEQVTDKVPTFVFIIQLRVDSTNSTDAAQLLIFLRGVDSDFSFQKSSLIWKAWGEQQQENIYLKPYHVWLKTWISLGQALWHYNGWSASDYGEQNRMASMVCNKVCEMEVRLWKCTVSYISALWQTIQMDDVMTTVVKTINLIRSRALKHREIWYFCLILMQNMVM